jgi:hypothetical protein
MPIVKALPVEEIIDALYAPYVTSTNRLRELLRLVAFAPADTFWPVFNRIWPSCDDTSWYQGDVVTLLRNHRATMPLFLGAEASEFYRSLPSAFKVYRGCSRNRSRGLSWTLSANVAFGFARGHRGIRVPDPVIASAVVSKNSVLAVFAERSESEILIAKRTVPHMVDYDPQWHAVDQQERDAA